MPTLDLDLSTQRETCLLCALINPTNQTFNLNHSRGGNFTPLLVLPVAQAVQVARYILETLAATAADEALIARYEAMCDARYDAANAHWGHD